jgi:6-phosphogluconolactonase
MPVTPDIHIAGDGHDWAHDAAAVVRAISEESIRSQGRFLIALSGGSTPRALYSTLASPEWRTQFNWSRTFFLFGDERCVPPDHPDSNFGMAHTVLFHPLGIPPNHIYRIQGETQDSTTAAQQYEESLCRLTESTAAHIPRIDLILLGLGEDGHTASLFPGTAALLESKKAVTVGQAPTGIRSRLTLTLGVINRASVVMFLVAGSNKAPIVRAILEPQNAAERILPAAMVVPETGRLIWMLDRSAAAKLTVGREDIRGYGKT